MKQIVIVQGHPDGRTDHFGHARKPALVYRWYYGAYRLKSLRASLLAILGLGPVRV